MTWPLGTDSGERESCPPLRGSSTESLSATSAIGNKSYCQAQQGAIEFLIELRNVERRLRQQRLDRLAEEELGRCIKELTHTSSL